MALIKCIDCGNIFTTTYKKLRYKKKGCSVCQYNNMRNSMDKIKRKIRQYYAVNTPEGKILTIELLDKSIIRHHCRDFNYKDWCSALSNGYLLVCDGGCDVITVEINLTTKQIIRFRCNGDA